MDEARVRATALPAALVLAWVAVKISPALVALIGMWVHETGHAVAAWLCGYQAFPGPWFTPIAGDRSPFFTLLLVGIVCAGGYRAWQLGRTFWIASAAIVVLLIAYCTFVLSPASAQQLIIFSGDGGSLVLGTLLMLTVYARESNPVRANQLRWGFLVIGAFAFVGALGTWTGPIDQLPFGENENGLSDPTVLTEQFGWTTRMLIDRYRQLANACLAAMAAVYLVHLLTPRPARSR